MNISADNDTEDRRITLRVDGEEAGYLTYDINGNIMDIQHTVIDPLFRGRDLGKVLVDCAVCFAKYKGLIIQCSCSYAKKVTDKQL